MMNCKQATQLLSESQDREISLKERFALKIHVMLCAGCRNFALQMQLLRGFAYSYSKGEGEKESFDD